MDNNISKAEFLRNCFKEMLDDGKPHRYRELLEFARQQIQGTRFDEKIQPNLFIQYVNSVIKKPDSDYERVQFGIYQKKSPQRKLEIKSDNELDRLYSMLDCSCALKEQMEKHIPIAVLYSPKTVRNLPEHSSTPLKASMSP